MKSTEMLNQIKTLLNIEVKLEEQKLEKERKMHKTIKKKLETRKCATVLENHKKVSFNIASEASGQKFVKNAKNGPFWRVFKKTEACGQTVLPDRLI